MINYFPRCLNGPTIRVKNRRMPPSYVRVSRPWWSCDSASCGG